MIVINMPGGGVRDIDEAELLWLRKAFDGEWKGATMLQLAADRLYSHESIDNLRDKFGNAGEPLVGLSAPAGRMKLFVSAHRVRQVIEGNPVIYDEKAKSVLLFASKMRLAVRETPEEVRSKLTEAGVPVA
ncbi:hypothetical protein [Bradyrhizobium diazoefficiens]